VRGKVGGGVRRDDATNAPGGCDYGQRQCAVVKVKVSEHILRGTRGDPHFHDEARGFDGVILINPFLSRGWDQDHVVVVPWRVPPQDANDRPWSNAFGRRVVTLRHLLERSIGTWWTPPIKAGAAKEGRSTCRTTSWLITP